MPLTKITGSDFDETNNSGLIVSGIVTATSLLLNNQTLTGTASQPLQVNGGAYVSGAVGIGSTNPQEKLDVQGGNGYIRIGEVYSLYNGITLNNSTADANYNFISSPADSGLYINRPSNRPIYFRMNNSDQMILNSSGNLLIANNTDTGTASQPLQVTGGAYVSGNLGVGVTNPGNKLVIGGETAQFPVSFQILSTLHSTSRRASIGLGGTIRNQNPDWQILMDKNGINTKDFSIYSTALADNPFVINTNGSINTVLQPAIELNGNNAVDIDFTANAQLLTSTYYTQVSNRGGLSWNSSTGLITVPTTGYYFISMFVYCNAAGNGDGRIQIRANASNRIVFQVRASGTNTATLLLNLAANDTVDVIADGFDLPRLYMGSNHTRFNMFLLG